jgi:RNA polymerase sigma-70 factor (ECF subfamily)
MQIMLLVEDRPLLDAFRRGDRAALEKVYFHYVDAVAALVQRGFVIEARSLKVPGIGDPALQADLVQEVFIRAFAEGARASYDGIRPFQPYVLRIAKNLMIDRLRRAEPTVSIEPMADVSAVLLDAAASAPEPEGDLDWQQLVAVTSEYVATLSPELREYIRLRFEEERSQDEVAAQMSVTRRRVRTLEGRAQTGLRKHLKRLGLLAR